MKISFKTEREIRVSQGNKNWEINYQLTCTTRNVKWTPSGKRNVISDRNFNLYEEIKNARRSKNEELFTEGSEIYYM